MPTLQTLRHDRPTTQAHSRQQSAGSELSESTTPTPDRPAGPPAAASMSERAQESEPQLCQVTDVSEAEPATCIDGEWK